MGWPTKEIWDLEVYKYKDFIILWNSEKPKNFESDLLPLLGDST